MLNASEGLKVPGVHKRRRSGVSPPSPYPVELHTPHPLPEPPGPHPVPVRPPPKGSPRRPVYLKLGITLPLIIRD